jgi:acyl carrier protein phosphodiesterase
LESWLMRVKTMMAMLKKIAGAASRSPRCAMLNLRG